MTLKTLDKDPSKKPLFKEGVLLLVDKPKHWTSFDVVNRLRYKISRAEGVKRIKVGHAGTLDPLATGLLLICTGKYTKKIELLQNKTKAYSGSLVLGATTPSYDLETEIDNTFETEHITEQMIQDVVEKFSGDIEQKPPIYSAIKKDGERFYKKARRGEIVEMPTRKVHISNFEITNINLPEVDFFVDCSKGTYIRSLAFDVGRELNSGAYLSNLVRESVGEYQLKDAWDLQELITYIESVTPIKEEGK